MLGARGCPVPPVPGRYREVAGELASNSNSSGGSRGSASPLFDPNVLSKNERNLLFYFGSMMVPLRLSTMKKDLTFTTALSPAEVEVAVKALETKGYLKSDGDKYSLAFNDEALNILRYYQFNLENDVLDEPVSFTVYWKRIEPRLKTLSRKKPAERRELDATRKRFGYAVRKLEDAWLIHRKDGDPYIDKDFIVNSAPLVRAKVHINRAIDGMIRKGLVSSRDSAIRIGIHDLTLYHGGGSTASGSSVIVDWDALEAEVTAAVASGWAGWHGWKPTKVGKNSGSTIEISKDGTLVLGSSEACGYRIVVMKGESGGYPSVRMYLTEHDHESIKIQHLHTAVRLLALELEGTVAGGDNVFTLDIEDSLVNNMHMSIDFMLVTGEVRRFFLNEIGSGITFGSFEKSYLIRFYPFITRVKEEARLIREGIIDPPASCRHPRGDAGGSGTEVDGEGAEIRLEIDAGASNESLFTVGDFMAGRVEDPVIRSVHSFMKVTSNYLEEMQASQLARNQIKAYLEENGIELERVRCISEFSLKLIEQQSAEQSKAIGALDASIARVEGSLNGMEASIEGIQEQVDFSTDEIARVIGFEQSRLSGQIAAVETSVGDVVKTLPVLEQVRESTGKLESESGKLSDGIKKSNERLDRLVDLEEANQRRIVLAERARLKRERESERKRQISERLSDLRENSLAWIRDLDFASGFGKREAISAVEGIDVSQFLPMGYHDAEDEFKKTLSSIESRIEYRRKWWQLRGKYTFET